MDQRGTATVNQTRAVVAFLAAKGISDVGTALDFICLAVFVWVVTGSPLAVSAVGIVQYGGHVLGGRIAHRYGDSWNRKRAMIGADLVRTAVLLPLALLPEQAQLPWLYPAVLVVGAGQAVFGGTLSAAAPVLAGERIQLLNSVLSAMVGVARVIGMGLAAVAIELVGYRGVFALDASTYLVSAGALLFIRLQLRAEPTGATARPDLVTRTRNGLTALVAAGLLAPLVIHALDAFGSSSQHVGLPILGAQHDPQNPAQLAGIVWMAWAAGVVLGSLAVRPLLWPLIARSPLHVFYAGTIVMSAGFVGIFWLEAWPALFAAAVVAGIGDSLTEVTYKQTIQQLPDDRRGSTFGLSQMAVGSGFLLGLLVTGFVLTPAIVPEWVLLMHGIPALAVVVALVVRTRARNA